MAAANRPRQWPSLLLSLAALGASAAALAVSCWNHDIAVRNSEPHFMLQTDPLGTNLQPGPLKIGARLKNVGTVTAYRVVAVGQVESPHWMRMDQAWFSIPHSADQDLEPGQMMPIPFGPEISLTADDVANLKAGKASLTFAVLVESDRAAAGSAPDTSRPSETLRRSYDRETGMWVRAFPGGNSAYQTH
jgi:hypothetical protein